MSTVSLLVRLSVCLFVPLVCFFCLCLLGCNPVPVIFDKHLNCYWKFWFCDKIVFFINYIITHYFFSFFHLFIGGEFKTLSSRDMVYPYPSIVWVSCLKYYLFCSFCFAKVNLLFWSLYSVILSNPSWRWHVTSSFIWHHLIMMARGIFYTPTPLQVMGEGGWDIFQNIHVGGTYVKLGFGVGIGTLDRVSLLGGTWKLPV